MSALRKPLYLAAPYTTTFMGSGRKEFNPKKAMRPFDDYLLETAKGTLSQIPNPEFDEGVIGSFMSARFIKQANLPGFLPFMVKSLNGKPCVAVEGACGTGGRAIATAAKGLLSELSEASFVAGFEIQNTMKAVYGADVLAGAAFYRKERKDGHAYFFPWTFAERAGAYYDAFGYEKTRRAMASWYANAICNARKNPKAQEYENSNPNLFETGMAEPNPERFLPYLNHSDCSKVSDGAASIALFTETGLKKCGIKKSETIELIAFGEAQGNIAEEPEDRTALSTSAIAIDKALKMANLRKDDIAVLEIHDCFTITAILAFEAIGFAERGKGPDFILEGEAEKEGSIPTNLSGGLGGFGHPTGASGVRQMVDLSLQLRGIAENQAKLKSPYGMMISMGGDDKTVTCLIVKRPD